MLCQNPCLHFSTGSPGSRDQPGVAKTPPKTITNFFFSIFFLQNVPFSNQTRIYFDNKDDQMLGACDKMSQNAVKIIARVAALEVGH